MTEVSEGAAPVEEDDERSALERSEEEVDGEPVGGDSPSRPSGTRSVIITEERVSPLPPERWLDVAEQHAPGVTRELVDDFLAQRRHARAIERRAIKQDEHAFGRFADYQTLQLACAASIALVIAFGGIALALAGKSLYGFAVLVAEVAGLVLAFLYGRTRGTRPADADA